MVQKIIWTVCSIFGINISLFVIIGCGKKTIEPVSSAEYVYINKMKTPVTIIAYDYDSYKAKTIPVNDSLTLLTGGSVGTRPFVDNQLANRADSVIIQFENQICTTYHRGNGVEDGVLDHKEYDNYSSSMISNGSYRYVYTIDSTDYKKAVPCK